MTKNKKSMKSNVINFLLLAFMIVVNLGCNDIEKKILGHWTIEDASLDTISVLQTEVMTMNSLFFSDDNECVLPNAFKNNYPSNKWHLFKNGGKLNIIFSNTSPYFNDTFRLSLINEDKVVLYNSHKHLTLSRF